MPPKLHSFWSLPLWLLIRLYQIIRDAVLTPLLYSAFGTIGECRYEESCSRYAVRMLREHATIPALGKILRRLASCHGFGGESVK